MPQACGLAAVGLVPMVVYVQKLARLVRLGKTRGKSAAAGGAEGDDASSEAKQVTPASILYDYIDNLYKKERGITDEEQEARKRKRQMLKRAFRLRALVLLVDGVDEAAGCALCPHIAHTLTHTVHTHTRFRRIIFSGLDKHEAAVAHVAPLKAARRGARRGQPHQLQGRLGLLGAGGAVHIVHRIDH